MFVVEKLQEANKQVINFPKVISFLVHVSVFLKNIGFIEASEGHVDCFMKWMML